MNIRVRELKELVDIAQCDVNQTPLKCDTEAKQNLWHNATGEFKFSNQNYKYNVKFNNMLDVYRTMLKTNPFRYDLDIFKSTNSVMNFKNDNYELNFEVPNVYGKGFWPNKESIWGMPDRESLFKTMAGNVTVESHLHHKYLDCNLYVNEVFTDDILPYTDYQSLTEAQILEVTEKKFKTMSEMFDRETIFKSFDKYGFGVALKKDGNIDLVFAFSSPINNNVKAPEKPLSKLFNGPNNWPYIGVPAGQENFNSEQQVNWWGEVISKNPLDKEQTLKLWIKANQLTFVELNKKRTKDGLKPLVEDLNLNQISQAAAERMAEAGKFVEPIIPPTSNDVIVVAMLLKGETKLNEYLFKLNDNNFGQLTCFDNFSNQKYPIREITEIDNFRYSCSINSGRERAANNWKIYDSFGTGLAYNDRGDTYHIFTLTNRNDRTEL